MKRIRVLIFILVALAQLAVPAMLAWERIQTLAHGRVWKFKTAPIDPEDAIRGRYVGLRFAAESFPAPAPAKSDQIEAGSTVYVVLKEDANGFAQVDHVSPTELKGDNVVKARSGYSSEDTQKIWFPFDTYWLTEKSAPAAETAYRENSRRGKENAYVTVRVRDGDAALEQLYIDDKPLAEYLRAEAASAQAEKK
jgi:uncharacterized membrane-anchored protein